MYIKTTIFQKSPCHLPKKNAVSSKAHTPVALVIGAVDHLTVETHGVGDVLPRQYQSHVLLKGDVVNDGETRVNNGYR